MTRKKTTITLSISYGEKRLLEELAIRHGCKWGDSKPNVSELISKIATGEISLSGNSESHTERDLSEIYEGISRISQGLALIAKSLSK